MTLSENPRAVTHAYIDLLCFPKGTSGMTLETLIKRYEEIDRLHEFRRYKGDDFKWART